MTPGQPITTKSGRRGVIVIPPGSREMPYHALIEFPGGVKLWVVKDAIGDDSAS